MKKRFVLVAALCAALGVSAIDRAQAQGSNQAKPGLDKPGLERLYILNCGEGVAGDISRWSPGVNEGKSMPFVDNCYLLKHSQGWMIWDTGLTDALAARPDGQKPEDPRATHWYRPKTLASQLEQLGVKASDIKYVAVSHTHPDHIGNVEMFPQAMLLVQKAEYEWPTPLGVGRFKPEHPVKLPKTGALLLSGDAVHFKSNWDNRGVPAGNSSQEQTRASMNRMAEIMAKEKATLWINHDKAQRDTLKMSPEYYE